METHIVKGKWYDIYCINMDIFCCQLHESMRKDEENLWKTQKTYRQFKMSASR